MPESKKRKKVIERERAQARVKTNTNEELTFERSAKWWAPTMVALAIIGLLVVVTAYVTNGAYPIPNLSNGNINLFLGLGLMFSGFLMTMGWK